MVVALLLTAVNLDALQGWMDACKRGKRAEGKARGLLPERISHVWIRNGESSNPTRHHGYQGVQPAAPQTGLVSATHKAGCQYGVSRGQPGSKGATTLSLPGLESFGVHCCDVYTWMVGPPVSDRTGAGHLLQSLDDQALNDDRSATSNEHHSVLLALLPLKGPTQCPL